MGPLALTSWLSAWIQPGWVTVGVAIGLAAVTVAYVRSGPIGELKKLTGRQLPEGRPFRGYTTETVREFLSSVRDDGSSDLSDIRVRYRRALRLDQAFAVVFSFALILILDGTLGVALKSTSPFRWSLLAPLAAGITDLVEDRMLLRATEVEVDEVWTSRASKATWIKWTLVTLTLAGVALGAIMLGVSGSAASRP